MAVPAGDVGGVEAGHGLGFDDEVLDAFVEGVAEVDGSVGVGRAVVEDIFGGSGAGGADLGIQVLLLPRLKALGLVLRQVAPSSERSSVADLAWISTLLIRVFRLRAWSEACLGLRPAFVPHIPDSRSAVYAKLLL